MLELKDAASDINNGLPRDIPNGAGVMLKVEADGMTLRYVVRASAAEDVRAAPRIRNELKPVIVDNVCNSSVGKAMVRHKFRIEYQFVGLDGKEIATIGIRSSSCDLGV